MPRRALSADACHVEGVSGRRERTSAIQPEEPTARGRYVEARRVTASRVAGFYTNYFAHLDGDAIQSLVTLTMALADGLFIASEVDSVALDDAFDIMASAILATADRLARAD